MHAKTYFADEHEIDSTFIDPDALFVIHKLREAGYTAYLVGGSVRDLLVKKSPKDFDISTSALPEEIKSLFGRQCILIGRRFRLAHVRFGRKALEVSTFRASGENEAGLIIQDNKWGSEEEDVTRRDFTINGLFYDPLNHLVIDYVGGWKDIHQKILRTIGDPVIRFKQDPVRMIRLLKFRARFGFEIDEPTETAIRLCKAEIIKSSPARILEEIFRMLESGASAAFFKLMTEYGLLDSLFPSMTSFLKSKQGEKVYHYLDAADKLILHKGRNVLDRSVLTACFLYPILESEIKKQFTKKGNTPHIGDVMMLTSSIIKGTLISAFSHFPRKISSTTGFILTTQYRFTPPSGKKYYRPKILGLKEFAHAMKFLKLRALVDEKLVDTYIYWKDLYQQHDGHKQEKHHHHSPHRRRYRKDSHRPSH